MGLLVFVTILWAFSFSLIGEFLAGQVDSDFAVLSRVLIGALVFLPFTRWRGVPGGMKLGILATGMLQFGITYLCLYRSFSYLTVPEVLLFTIFTPLYVTLIDDALFRRFSPVALLAAAVATLGAGIIRYDGLSEDFIIGFLLLQVANFTFAAGQVGYKHVMQHFPIELGAHRTFGYFFLGALTIALPSFLIFGHPDRLPSTSLQWGVLAWLGFAASGLGLFLWNRGACKVDAGTLAIMNNALVPAGLLVNLLIWNRDADLMRLAVGGGVIAFSLWLNARFHPRARLAASA
ncbi:carboxylate/amino acid/amine transporter [Marinobacter koreensis]|jgi:carboxylate/amino acid/amine transporter|uniref:Carboxylate/amino acid/amine transporter n=2 Tax=Marinobacter TaxID=2742 RepID=M7D140_9GAMM|nr:MULTISPECIES: carboxylate/amino acid/amine transporter [Marinobacter]EMP54453.1 carboxylate/amino acid/amine transporter [Marinobacter santoriniensis NKSG1]MCK7548770.1 carboxylate/amino acid/amine transporter [Marinobacter koreensis]